MAIAPDVNIFTNEDYDIYAEILHSTNALRRNNDESETKLKANKCWKCKHILKKIWDEKDVYTGNGLTPSFPIIILPCDIVALVSTYLAITSFTFLVISSGGTITLATCDFGVDNF